VPDAVTAFHDYGAPRQADRITYFIDRKLVADIKVPVSFVEPMYMIAIWRLARKILLVSGLSQPTDRRIRDRPDLRLSDQSLSSEVHSMAPKFSRRQLASLSPALLRSEWRRRPARQKKGRRGTALRPHLQRALSGAPRRRRIRSKARST
jgi:hypothetical protein